ncbi:chorismate-binding protein [Hymenobacter sp. CRA2]|uniref:chorismate-binding protein n=1 Tax=Hymenobacter sp. CRA2 TaxID=1955620 RepID=UPI00098F942C|nr:chorismate-binding protein [Hymenobacter sp. CRA2]OON68511.1 chorismate-binding protein [Hymenobacter sp. CRA2]
MTQKQVADTAASATVRRLVALALRHEGSVALWRLPHAAAPVLLLSLRPLHLSGLPPSLEPTAPAGFAFYPFQDGDTAEAMLLPADVVLDFSAGQQLSLSHALPVEAVAAVQRVIHETTEPEQLAWHVSPQPLPATTDRGGYETLVAQAVGAIRAGQMTKVVSSRAALRPLPAGFDTLKAFDELCRQHPRAFVSLVSAPQAGTWLGATPEVLVETDGAEFRTMALAGTQPLTPDITANSAMWRQKDIEEQAMVGRYVVGCFKQLRIRDYDETGPKTVQAGNLLHLRTEFRVDLKRVTSPTFATDMLRLLHPTSAVGGMPREAALGFLQRHEGYDRTYYSGFLGPVNLPAPGTSRLFVNLRCMQLRPTEAILYAGTGLTTESDPAKEWQETEMKLRTVGSVLDE